MLISDQNDKSTNAYRENILRIIIMYYK